MKKSVLLTRPRASSKRWAALLSAQGFDCTIEPLLRIVPTQEPRPNGAFQATLITSAQAPEALAALGATIADLLPLPCFCVGASTAAAARACGFTDVRSGASDSAALAQMMVATLSDKQQPLLHIAGDIVDGKAQEILSRNGFTVTPWTVYSADAAEDFTAPVRAALAHNAFDAIPVFSPRSARILVSLIEKNRLTHACHNISAIALSQAVADMLQTLPWRQLRVAASPSEEDVLASLQSVFAMTTTENTVSPGLVPPVRRKKRKAFAGIALAVIVLAAAGAVAIARNPILSPLLSVQKIQPVPDTAALEQRVTLLESRLDALAEAPAPTTPANNADTAKAIEAVQARLSQIENQGKNDQVTVQKLVAASFTFWDLREAAQAGHGFARQLADLRALAGNDAIVSEQAAKLEPYAAGGAPNLAQLRDELATAETSLPAEATENDASLWGKIKKIMTPLVSVHPAHSPQLANVEDALNKGDAAAALADIKVLPAETQKSLAAWQAKLEARIAIDAALQILTAHVIAPPSPGNAPGNAQGNAP